jgi:hypothetical protein
VHHGTSCQLCKSCVMHRLRGGRWLVTHGIAGSGPAFRGKARAFRTSAAVRSARMENSHHCDSVAYLTLNDVWLIPKARQTNTWRADDTPLGDADHGWEAIVARAGQTTLPASPTSPTSFSPMGSGKEGTQCSRLLGFLIPLGPLSN